jgi:hypothetical protein
MKIKNIIFLSIFLLAILTIGAASATQDSNSTDQINVEDEGSVGCDDVTEVSDDDSQSDDVIGTSDKDIQADEDDEDYDRVNIEMLEDVDYGDDDYISIELPKDAEGLVTVKINGKPATLSVNKKESLITVVKVDSGSAVSISAAVDVDWDISLDNLPSNIYNVTVEYTDTKHPGNAKYYDKKQEMICVGDFSVDDEIEVEEVYIYKSQFSKIYLPSADLSVSINNKQYPISKADGVNFVDLSTLDLGVYTIKITKGNDVLVDEEFEIGGIIEVPERIDYNSKEFIILNLPDDADGSLVIYKGSVEVKRIKLVNGSANYSLEGLGIGYHKFRAEYDGDDYEVEDFDDEIEVVPIVRIPSVMRVKEDKYIEFELDKNAKGTFDVKYDTMPYDSVDVYNGKAKISLSRLEDGVATIDIEYWGEDGTFFDWSFDVEVLPMMPKLYAENIKMVYMDGTRLKVKVYGTNGKLAEEDEDVDIKIGKKEYVAYVNSKGIATLKIKNAPGKYKVLISYGDATISKTLIIKHALKLKKVKVKKSAKKLVLSATLKIGKKPLKNKKVTFKFNGKKLKAKTNKKGVAKVTVKKTLLNKLKVGKKVKYQAKYLKDTVKKSVKVKG